MSAAELKRNLEGIRGLLDPIAPLPQTQAPAPAPQLSPQQHNALAMHRPVSGFCAVHNVEMKLNDKNGRQWWSHRTADGWCKGR